MLGKSVNVVVLTLSLLPTEKVFLNQFQKITERMMSRTEILIESYQKKKALEICWDIEKDTFKFPTDLKEKPMTQGGMLIVSSIYDPHGFVAPFILKGKRLPQMLC